MPLNRSMRLRLIVGVTVGGVGVKECVTGTLCRVPSLDLAAPIGQ